MNVYADTNLLIQLYLDLDGTGRARDILYGPDIQPEWPLPITRLLDLEFRNALQRLVFESGRGGQWRITAEAATASQAFFESHLEEEVLIKENPLTLGDIKLVFEDVCGRHTAKHGFRTDDVLHVAAARALGCERFLSFDRKASALAALEGMKTL